MLEIRPVASDEELERCYDLWDAVFPDGRAFFQERLAYDRTYRLETTWVARVDDALAAAQQIFPYRARYHGAAITVGGIGNVATLPSFRHRGLAQALLGRQMMWMREHGFGLGLLFTGIPDFYRQLGWQSVPLGTELKLPRARVFAAASTLDPAIHVRAADPSGKDLAALLDLYQRENADRPWTRIRDRGYWTDLQRWTRKERLKIWLAMRQSEIVAYLIVGRPPSRPATLVECGVRPGYDASLAGPLGVLLHKLWAVAEAGDEMVALLPDTHPLVAAGVEPHPYPGTMAAILNPRQFEDDPAWKEIDSPATASRLIARRFANAESGFLWPLDHF